MSKPLRTDGDRQLEAQRDQAQQAARELAELDILSVILTLQGWIAAGETERARAFWIDYRKGTKA